MTSNYEEVINVLPLSVRPYVRGKAEWCRPDKLYLCDGSEKEQMEMIKILENEGMLTQLKHYENVWLARTDPADVARVESKTFISTPEKRQTIPIPRDGVKGLLGNWMSPEDLDSELEKRFPGCMKGRTMFIIPFSMGPIGGPISKIGVQLTDSPYVVASMRIMTRMGTDALDQLEKGASFVKCLHSVGQPLPMAKPPVNGWPCYPEKTIISHIPHRNEIASFGSGYGGNSLLGKKCFALRLGSILARDEGWLAEHMLILGITNPAGVKKYIAAAFPSACGKTNMAMMQATLPGYKIECVGDDIAWMKPDKDGNLRAINPEYGFFGVAPGTSSKTNPHALTTISKNTIYTNVAMTTDGRFYWEGLEKECDITGVGVIDWTGKEWKPGCGRKAAHPNSRFCTPASQCPIIDEKWESPEGVPIEAIIFGGRRPEGVPLIYEARNWRHGVFIGGAMRSESTAAAEHAAKQIMHDPFAMRPFFGYNFGHYMQHWLSFENRNLKLPKIFHVNWFRKDFNGNFIWPGFGENCRVLEYVLRRLEGEDIAKDSPIGLLPKPGTINIKGIPTTEEEMDELFHLPRDFWIKEASEIRKYFEEQVGSDLPDAINAELEYLERRVKEL